MAFMIAEGTANGLDLEAPLRYKLEQICMDWFVCHDPSSKSSSGAYCAEHKNRKSGNPFRIRDDLVNTNILFMQLLPCTHYGKAVNSWRIPRLFFF